MSDAANTKSPDFLAVSYRADQLTGGEQWRLTLRRLYPKAARPLQSALSLTVLLVVWLGAIGYGIGLIAGPNTDPWLLARCTGLLGLLLPLRIWIVKKALMRAFREVGSITIEVGPDGLATQTAHRSTQIQWAGVRDVLATRDEVAVRLRAGDLLWAPRRLFRDEEHCRRFVDAIRSGLAPR